jgi:hypothetical protein
VILESRGTGLLGAALRHAGRTLPCPSGAQAETPSAKGRQSEEGRLQPFDVYFGIQPDEHITRSDAISCLDTFLSDS